MTETTKTPETFVAGETVEFYHGESRYPVKVIAVDGTEVIANVHGEQMLFTPRADGKHVKLGSLDTDIMPDMIFHAEPVAEVKKSFFKRFAHLFA